MSGMSRRKGQRGELEVVAIAKAHGFDSRRLAQLQAGTSTRPGDADVGLGIEHLFMEVKRQETIKILQWSRQAEAAALPTQVACVAYRSSREPWRCSLLLSDFLDLVKAANL